MVRILLLSTWVIGLFIKEFDSVRRIWMYSGRRKYSIISHKSIWYTEKLLNIIFLKKLYWNSRKYFHIIFFTFLFYFIYYTINKLLNHYARVKSHILCICNTEMICVHLHCTYNIHLCQIFNVYMFRFFITVSRFYENVL